MMHQWLRDIQPQSCGDVTCLLSLDCCCLSFYVTSSILAVKFQAVTTFTTRTGSLFTCRNQWDDLLIFNTQGFCSFRPTLQNVLHTSCGVMSGIKLACMTICKHTQPLHRLFHQLQDYWDGSKNDAMCGLLRVI